MNRSVCSYLALLLWACGSEATNAPDVKKGANERPDIETDPVGGDAGDHVPPNAECASDDDCLGFFCTGLRCVEGVACSARALTCSEPRPQCDGGEVASIVDGCWSVCVAPSNCADVDSCDVCAQNEICVTTEFEVSATGPFKRMACASAPSNCSSSDCECLGALCTVAPCGSVTGRAVTCSTTIAPRE
jgi:hypothetical protein